MVDGVAELVSRYAVDGVHFDDYFYPTTDPSIDAAQFAASGAQDLDAWRRQNVTALVKAAHDAVKAQDPTLRFGVSPQGNPDNDVHQQYSDVYGWLAAEGEDAVVDYLCPQLYWGYGYTLSGGSERFAYPNILAEWLAMPRGSATLYIGLGAYRIGDGDGGANPDSTAQWSTGQALARQVAELRAQGAGGYALYRMARCSQTAPGLSSPRPNARLCRRQTAPQRLSKRQKCGIIRRICARRSLSGSEPINEINEINDFNGFNGFNDLNGFHVLRGFSMNRSIIRALCALALAGALALSLAGCESIKNGVANALGFSSNAQQEEDTTNWPRPPPTPSCCPRAPTPPPSGPTWCRTAPCTGCTTASGRGTPAISRCRGQPDHHRLRHRRGHPAL